MGADRLFYFVQEKGRSNDIFSLRLMRANCDRSAYIHIDRLGIFLSLKRPGETTTRGTRDDPDVVAYEALRWLFQGVLP